jgi:hypothetical protein
LIVLAASPSPFAQAPKPPGIVLWDGKITISRQASAETREDKSEGDGVSIHFEEKKVDDVTVIEACGTGPMLKVYSAERSLEDTTEKGVRVEAASTHCGMPKEAEQHNLLHQAIYYDPIIKTPGNKTFRSEKTRTSLFEGEGVKPLEESTIVTLMVEDGGKYTLSVQSFAMVLHLQDHIYEDYNACTGKTKRTEHSIRPAAKGTPPGSSSESGKQEGKIVKTTHQTLPPLPLPAGFVGEGAVSGPMLEGSVEFVEKRSEIGGYDETTTSTWSLRAKDPCQDAYKQLLEDLAWAEAYLNADIQKQVADENIENIGQRIKTYEERVNQQVYRILHGEEPPEGELTDTDASVDGAGETEGLEELKERLARECKPDVIYDSIEKHEKTHQKQQKAFEEEYNAGDVVIFGLMEVTAYLAGVHVLLDWLDFNCPEMPLVSAKSRIQKIEKAKFSRN